MDQDNIPALMRSFDVLEGRTKILMDIRGASYAELEGLHYEKCLILERLKELSPLPARVRIDQSTENRPLPRR